MKKLLLILPMVAMAIIIVVLLRIVVKDEVLIKDYDELAEVQQQIIAGQDQELLLYDDLVKTYEIMIDTYCKDEI